MNIKEFFQRLFTAEAENWFFSHIPFEQTPEKEVPETVVADQHYVQVDVKSLRIVKSRKGLSEFYGVVHSFIKMPHLDGNFIEFNVVTTPAQLKQLDGEHIDRVIPASIPLLGQVPYRGAGIQIQLGLFSVKSTELTSSVIDLFSDMTETAGVSFVSAALPYAKFLSRGIGVLTGSTKDTILEIGLSTTITQFKTGYYVVMRAPKDQINISDLRISGDDFKLVGKDGKSIKDFPYIVYKISAFPIRSDWFMIPEVKSAYRKVKSNLELLRPKEAAKALAAFESVVLTTGDLLYQDAERIYDKVSKETKRIISAQEAAQKRSGRSPARGTVSAPPDGSLAVPHSAAVPKLPELEDLDVFSVSSH